MYNEQFEIGYQMAEKDIEIANLKKEIEELKNNQKDIIHFFKELENTPVPFNIWDTEYRVEEVQYSKGFTGVSFKIFARKNKYVEE
jgi:LEA14-like dessication related protein